ncbi:L,D-transpeptidase family protein [Limnochorda pilosa]|uniref:ErfK/YbiS/YcfS/YnhG family protein n=1 Tax=Limnochorda pilosa TaxID=1555112 RepID=A0A0K2SN07_LIMPI|nr:peptidoglycan-binding protein [Limnochorda pilosa]BAS28500.1 ErfK/YbiS/YcfS/YnhG family protein [Limnochorda pilosa]
MDPRGNRRLIRMVGAGLLLVCSAWTAAPALAQEPGDEAPSYGPGETLCGEPMVLRLGEPAATDPDVRTLQERLRDLGWYDGPLDGHFGPQTAEAVRRFQQGAGLDPTGMVTGATWRALAGDMVLPAAAGPSEAPRGELSIVIDTNERTLTLFSDGKPYKAYPVAVGTGETPSPVGEWLIVHKDSGWGDGFGTRWLGLNVPWGIYGIHGTNKPWSIGTRASHGCIRMFNRDVEELHRWVPLRTPVRIVGPQPKLRFDRALQPGATGTDVVQVQLRLKELGFDLGLADGRYGPKTEEAVRALQRFYGLPEDGRTYDDVYFVLGLRRVP